MWQIWLTRVFALCLTVSGAWMLPAIAFPVFWPGVLVWIGWVTIALGFRKFNQPWFWLVATSWDGFWMFVLYMDTDWGSYDKAPSYWHLRRHVALSVALSVVAFSILLIKRRKAELPCQSKLPPIPN